MTRRIGLFGAVIGLVSAAVLVNVFAGGQLASLEIEASQRGEGADVITGDWTASGGSFVQFRQVQTGGGGGNHPIAGTACIGNIGGAGNNQPTRVEQWPNNTLFIHFSSENPLAPFFNMYDGVVQQPWGQPPAVYETNDAQFNVIIDRMTSILNANGCGPLMLNGYSNGGGLQMKIYCRGVDFDGRLWGLIVDDPVPDATVDNCNPSPSVQRITIYRSEELEITPASFTNNSCKSNPITDTGRNSSGDQLSYPWEWYCEDATGYDGQEYRSRLPSQVEYVLCRGLHYYPNPSDDDCVQNGLTFWAQQASWWNQYDPSRF